MARRRIELPAGSDERIRAAMLRGESAASIAESLGGGASARTIARRMAEMRYGVEPPAPAHLPETAAGVSPAGPSEPPPDLPEDPEHIPEGTPIEKIDRWIARVDRLAGIAELHNDTARMGNLGRLMSNLLEVRRKNIPIAKADPNENPDMLAAKERARAAFAKILDALAGV